MTRACRQENQIFRALLKILRGRGTQGLSIFGLKSLEAKDANLEKGSHFPAR